MSDETFRLDQNTVVNMTQGGFKVEKNAKLIPRFPPFSIALLGLKEDNLQKPPDNVYIQPLKRS